MAAQTLFSPLGILTPMLFPSSNNPRDRPADARSAFHPAKEAKPNLLEAKEAGKTASHHAGVIGNQEGEHHNIKGVIRNRRSHQKLEQASEINKENRIKSNPREPNQYRLSEIEPHHHKVSKRKKAHVIHQLSEKKKENITTSKESSNIGEVTKLRDSH